MFNFLLAEVGGFFTVKVFVLEIKVIFPWGDCWDMGLVVVKVLSLVGGMLVGLLSGKIQLDIRPISIKRNKLAANG